MTAGSRTRMNGLVASSSASANGTLGRPAARSCATRREEMLLSNDEVKITWKLRRALAGLDPQQALEVVLGKLKETGSNVEFLVQMQKSIPAPAAGGHGGGHDNSIR